MLWRRKRQSIVDGRLRERSRGAREDKSDGKDDSAHQLIIYGTRLEAVPGAVASYQLPATSYQFKTELL